MTKIIENVKIKFNAQVILFATNYPYDIMAAEEVICNLSDSSQVKVVRNRLEVREILSLLAGSDVVIGTRLHSLILSFVAGTPALALAYQPKS